MWYMKEEKFKYPKGVVSLKVYTGDCELGRSAAGRVFVEVWT